MFRPEIPASAGVRRRTDLFHRRGKDRRCSQSPPRATDGDRDGTFTKALFELRGEPDLAFLKGRDWSWADNPFRGTPEFAGLKIAMMLLSNWDGKDARDTDDSNNAVLRQSADGAPVLRYIVFVRPWTPGSSTSGPPTPDWRNAPPRALFHRRHHVRCQTIHPTSGVKPFSARVLHLRPIVAAPRWCNSQAFVGAPIRLPLFRPLISGSRRA